MACSTNIRSRTTGKRAVRLRAGNRDERDLLREVACVRGNRTRRQTVRAPCRVHAVGEYDDLLVPALADNLRIEEAAILRKRKRVAAWRIRASIHLRPSAHAYSATVMEAQCRRGCRCHARLRVGMRQPANSNRQT